MPVVATLDISEAGIRYQWYSQNGKHQHLGLLSWQDIALAKAFKRDLFTYDLICLQLQSKENITIEIDEEDLNWTALMEAMPRYLAGCKTWGTWFSEVAFPAFEENQNVLFERTFVSAREG
jgi:hypothetical protein